MSLLRTLSLAAACAVALPAGAQPALDPAAFHACLNTLAGTAAFQRITPATFQRYTAQLQPDPTVLVALNRQPEFTIPVWDYMAMLVDPERITDGRAAAQKWHPVLQQIQERTGVAPALVTAVWGVESNYGKNMGGRPLVQSLATLSCFGRRQAYFRGEFADALRILQEGHIPADKLTGSWAGAFGQTQFMPSTFFRNAVDFDGDGRRDIVDSVPDALASTAQFLKNAGYRPGQPWGFEVRLPPGFNTAGAGRKNKKPIASWRAAGVTLVNGQPLPGTLPSAGLLIPAAGGPAFLVGRNFDTLYSYNASENYALAIAVLSDMIANPARKVAIQTPWPTDDPGLSRAENRELQTLLQARGYDVGTVDGLIGTQTRAAIQAEQTRLGWQANGRAGQKLLAALRGAQPKQ